MIGYDVDPREGYIRCMVEKNAKELHRRVVAINDDGVEVENVEAWIRVHELDGDKVLLYRMVNKELYIDDVLSNALEKLRYAVSVVSTLDKVYEEVYRFLRHGVSSVKLVMGRYGNIRITATNLTLDIYGRKGSRKQYGVKIVRGDDKLKIDIEIYLHVIYRGG